MTATLPADFHGELDPWAPPRPTNRTVPGLNVAIPGVSWRWDMNKQGAYLQGKRTFPTIDAAHAFRDSSPELVSNPGLMLVMIDTRERHKEDKE